MIPAKPAEASYAEYLATPEWRTRRDEAVARAEGRCQLCNSSKYLNVHHRSYERLGRERESDLTVLCRRCHERFHRKTIARKRRRIKRELERIRRGPARGPTTIPADTLLEQTARRIATL